MKNADTSLKTVCIIYIVTTIFYGILGSYPKAFMIYPDEIRYIGISRSLVNNGSFIIQNCYVPYQKLFYGLCLLPAFLIGNTYNQMMLINWLNAILMCSVVFPVYLFGRNISGSIQFKNIRLSKSTLFILFAAVCPFLVNSQFYMSENAFFPLCMWILWIMYKYIMAEEQYLNVGINVLLGILFYLAYFCKEVALYFPISYALYIIYRFVITKKNNRNALWGLFTCLGTFALIFAVTKMTIFANMGNSYNQQDIASVFSVHHLLYCGYSFIYMLLFTILMFGVIPVFFPIKVWNKMSEKDKALWMICNLIIVIMCFTIAYTISIREDFGDRSPKLVLRYLEVFVIPYIYLMFKYFCMADNSDYDRLYKKSTVIYLVLFVLLGYTNDSRLTDNMLLRYYYIINEGYEAVSRRLIQSGVLLAIADELVYLGIRLIMAYCIYRLSKLLINNSKKFIGIFSRIFILICFVGIVGSLAISILKYKVPDNLAREAAKMNVTLSEYNGDNVLIIAQDDMTKRLLDTYVDANVFVEDSEGMSLYKFDESTIGRTIYAGIENGHLRIIK